MRKEYIEFNKGLPIKMKLLEIDNYPLHWHKAIEIVFVLKGSIDIEIGTGNYTIVENEIEIVNYNEIHSLKKREGENLVLLVNIDPDFFEKYYEGAREVFFYADSSNRKIQESRRYKELRGYIAILFYEIISEFEDSKDIIEDKLLGLMFHLLNNFHYLFYEEESLRDDDLELERYHRIVNYISNNYMNKVSLQEIADKEFLTSQYLSFKIKNTFGYGFNDFLNLTRVEESVKLLLNTDKNISEISEEVGFSHVRYYNKHFKLHYNLSPNEYRKKYKLSEEELEELTVLKSYPLEDGLKYLKRYLETYERYDYDDKINKFDIDILKTSGEEFTYPKIINLGKGRDIYNFKDRDKIIRSISKLGFTYGLIDSLDGILDEYEDGDKINWYYLENLIEIILNLDLKPIFIIDGYENIIKKFKKYIKKNRKDINLEDIIFTKKIELYKDRENLFKDNNRRNDIVYIVGEVFTRSLEKNPPIPEFIDGYSKLIEKSDTFYGGKGITTFNSLKKPTYYAYQFMSFLGDEILYKDKGLLVTRSEEGFEILLFHPFKEDEEKRSHIGQKKRFSINILNMLDDYRITKYELSKDSGSIYDKWDYLGRPRILSKEYMNLLEESTVPEIKFYYGKKSTVYNIVATVEDRGAQLYLFRKVQ